MSICHLNDCPALAVSLITWAFARLGEVQVGLEFGDPERSVEVAAALARAPSWSLTPESTAALLYQLPPVAFPSACEASAEEGSAGLDF